MDLELAAWIVIGAVVVLAALVARLSWLLVGQLRSLRDTLAETRDALREALDEVGAEARKASEGLERLGRRDGS